MHAMIYWFINFQDRYVSVMLFHCILVIQSSNSCSLNKPIEAAVVTCGQ